MKKIGLVIAFLAILVIPINIYALGICNGQRECSLNPYLAVTKLEGSDGNIEASAVLSGGDHGDLYGSVTKTLYDVDIDSPIFCIDVGNLNPKSVNKAVQIDMDSALHKGLVAIYRLYLMDGASQTALVTANDAMRILVARTGSTLRYSDWWLGNEKYCWGSDDRDLCLGNDKFVKALANAGAGLAGQSTDPDFPTVPNASDMLKKYYCAGAKAYGDKAGNFSDGDSRACQSALSGVDMSLLTIENTDFNLVEDTTVPQNGDEITFKLSGDGYENLKSVFEKYPSIKDLTEVYVTKCDVDETSKSLGFTCEIVNGDKNILDNGGIQKLRIYTNNKIVSVSTNVTAHLSIKVTNPFSTTSLAILQCEGDRSCANKGPDDAEYVNQRLLMVDKDREDEADINVHTTVEASCKFVVGNDDEPIYLINNNEVTEKEYLEAGCCDVNPEYLKEDNSKEHFKNFCMEEDFVHFENECGTKSIVDKQHITNQVASGSVSLTTCEVESYVDYTHSYIWQLPMERVMEKVKTLETSEAYQNNTNGLYESTAISNNLDKCYMTSTVGTAGDQLVGIDIEKNQYCMLYTSEEDDLYFPGTAVATSGRFFVFNELSMEECLTQANPGPNCFRQPYVEGKIYATMHTNYEKWERDYNKAIEEEIAAYDAWKASSSDTDKQTYEIRKLQRETLEQYKIECEQRNDIQKYWNYNLAPTLDFRYKQRVYVNGNASEKEKLVEDTVAMSISSQAEKYWPFESTKPTVISGSISGSKSVKRFEIKYGDVNITKEFDQTTDYTVGFTQRLYYKPGKVTYATLPGGEYIIANDEYQATSPMFVNGGLEIGYVYNVRLTTYEGIYTTAFVIDKVGHTTDSCTNNTSNIQKTLDKYKAEHKWEELDSECVYCNQESEYKRVCDQCPDPNEPPLEAAYVYRSIALNNVTPNDRSNTNWSDAKGSSAEARIEALSGDNIISALANDTKVKATILGDAEKSAKAENVARGYIYDDSTKDYLEYDFTLTTKDLQMIKKNNRRAEFDYGTINFCTTGNADATAKDADIDYCMKCNEYGKECTSTFIDAFSDMSITSTTRNSKWKYYVNNQWVLGSMKTIEELKDGYPDPLNPNAWLNISQDGKQPNNNWP